MIDNTKVIPIFMNPFNEISIYFIPLRKVDFLFSVRRGFLKNKMQKLVKFQLATWVLLLGVSLASLNAETDGIQNDPSYSCDLSTCSESIEECPCEECCKKGNIFAIGPEFSYLKRKRAGGTRQHGFIYGVRASYDRLKRYHFYLGGTVDYSQGTLNGKSGNGNKLKSDWSEALIEGNLGYTLQYKYFPFWSLTPFVGYGYFRETNKFKNPTPLHLKFITQFPYVSYGFLSSLNITSFLNLGLNVRFRSPWNARCTIKDDPEFDTTKLLVGEVFQYRVEIPLAYCRPLLWNMVEFGIVPFYEYRCYEGRENFPFDFFKTAVRLYGANLQLIFRF